MTEDAIVVAEELARRFGLARWRFVNSGSEATMDAIRIARGLTGRDTIVKIFGSYHGHHDAVMVSIGVPYDEIGDRDDLASLPYGAGIPQAVVELTIPVPFNDAAAMERRIERLEREGRTPACVIMEAAMMNLGVVLPEPGYLEAVRDITRAPRHRADLRRGQDGPRDRRGRRDRALRRDRPTWSRSRRRSAAACRPARSAAARRSCAVVEDGSVYQVGTYNGNPLSMAAARASLEQRADAGGLPPPRRAQRAHRRRLRRP